MSDSLQSPHSAAARRVFAGVFVTAAVLAPTAGASGTGAAASRPGHAAMAVPSRAQAAPIETGTPLGCLEIGGLVNSHKSGHSVWAGFDMAYAAWVRVQGPYRTAAAASSAARARGRAGFAKSAKRYVVSAPMDQSMAPQVRAVAACLTKPVHRVGYRF